MLSPRSTRFNDEDGEEMLELKASAAQGGHNDAQHEHLHTLERRDTTRSLNSASTDPHVFETVHSSHHLSSHGAHDPVRTTHLFKRPVVRQFMLRDKLYYEKEERAATQVELFFDLIMVGVVHNLAEGAAEEASGLNVAKFVLLFFPAWSIWTDVRNFMNVSGTDDVVQRMYLLIVMGLLLGYSANATGITIKEADMEAERAGGEGISNTTEGAAPAGAALAGRALFTFLGRRASEAAHEPVLVREIGNTNFWFAEGYHSAIASALSFYLVAKCCRLILYFTYGWALPRFRKSLWLNGISLVIIALVYLPILFISDPTIIVTLMVTGVLLELALRYAVASILQLMHGRAKHRGHATYMPAYALPHLMERMTQFTILIMGESVVNATYIAYPGEYGANGVFGKAFLAMATAFFLIWIYFDVDSSRTFRHALTRHWVTSISFTHLHFPLSASLLLMSASFKALIQQESVDKSFIWLYSGSIAVAMVCFAAIGVLHKSLDQWSSALIPKSARICARLTLGGIFAIMPLMREWKSLPFLAAHMALMALAVAFETIGKLHAVGRVYDPVRADELRRARAAAKEQGAKGYGRSRHVKGPGPKDEWHEYADLTPAERGEEDVGIETSLGHLEAKYITSGERWAYVET